MRESRAPFVVLVTLASLLASSGAHAWSGHGRLTGITLARLPGLATKITTYVPLAEILPRLTLLVDTRVGGPVTEHTTESRNVLTEDDLILYLRIKKDSTTRRGYRFRAMKGEIKGQAVPALAIFAKYADEPDGWNEDGQGNEPDTMLFDADQYGDILWQDSYTAMGSRNSTASQAFRHMFWGKLDVWHLLASAKFPISEINKEMGFAYERAATYVDLARRAKKAGSTYWQARFLANALHYLEDCSQPFHVSQTPSKKLITIAGDPANPGAPREPHPILPVWGNVLGCAITGGEACQTYMGAITVRGTNVISYYHFAFEEFIDVVLRGDAGLPTVAAMLSAALVAPSDIPALRYADKDPEAAVRAMAKISVSRSHDAGESAITFFPTLSGKNLTTFDAHAALDNDWWNLVKGSAQDPENAATREYFRLVAESFAAMGQVVRAVVSAEFVK